MCGAVYPLPILNLFASLFSANQTCSPLYTFFFSSFRPMACYSSASLHLFIGRPRLLFPLGIPSWTFLISPSSAILDMHMLHSVLLLCTHDVMFWIPHVSRILSFRILSLLVLFIILLSVFISVTSNICIVFTPPSTSTLWFFLLNNALCYLLSHSFDSVLVMKELFLVSTLILLFCPEDGGNKFLRNTGPFLPSHRPLYPSRKQS